MGDCHTLPLSAAELRGKITTDRHDAE